MDTKNTELDLFVGLPCGYGDVGGARANQRCGNTRDVFTFLGFANTCNVVYALDRGEIDVWWDDTQSHDCGRGGTVYPPVDARGTGSCNPIDFSNGKRVYLS